ncbi:MAG: PQQ-dependent sugar dehydrogenase [Myxococcota bacterium]
MRTSSLAFLFGLPALALCLACGDAPGEVRPPDVDRPPNATCRALPAPPSAGRLTLERVFADELSGPAARELTHVLLPTGERPGFATRKTGQVLAFANGSSARVVLDLEDRLDFGAPESGLVSLALDPAFAIRRFAYLVYMVPPPDDADDAVRHVARVGRFTFDGERFDPASERIVLDVPQVSNVHQVNHVGFGVDGYLYVALGEQRKMASHPQDPMTLPGSVLRLDVREGTEDAPYAIPADNPFADGEEGAPEVFAFGFRNPWRFTVDPEGAIYVGDVGAGAREEIDVLVAGANYGWPELEGAVCFRATPDCDPSAFEAPLVDVVHPDVRSIVAGPRVRDAALSDMRDRVVFADFVTGGLWSTSLGGGDARRELEAGFLITSFAEGPGVHVVRYETGGDEGGVYRLVPNAPAPSTYPERLSETGCVDPDDPRRFAPGVVAYAPRAELWSAGAEKARGFAIPDGTALAVGSDGDFGLPVGSVLITHFAFGERLHETRLLMHSEEGWHGTSYRWNEDQTDAELLEDGRSEVLPNGVRWSYPRRSECGSCHVEASGTSLSLEAAQLDDVQLGALLEGGYVDRRVTELAALRGTRRPLLVDPEGEGPREPRVRAYLHANCAHCHQPGGPGRGGLDLRVETPLAGMRMCDREVSTSCVWGIDDAPCDDQKLVVPGAPELSVLLHRMRREGNVAMPPLGRGAPHAEALDLVEAWIAGLERCP